MDVHLEHGCSSNYTSGSKRARLRLEQSPQHAPKIAVLNYKWITSSVRLSRASQLEGTAVTGTLQSSVDGGSQEIFEESAEYGQGVLL